MCRVYSKVGQTLDGLGFRAQFAAVFSWIDLDDLFGGTGGGGVGWGGGGGLGLRVWGLGFGVEGLGFRVCSLRCRKEPGIQVRACLEL